MFKIKSWKIEDVTCSSQEKTRKEKREERRNKREKAKGKREKRKEKREKRKEKREPEREKKYKGVYLLNRGETDVNTKGRESSPGIPEDEGKEAHLGQKGLLHRIKVGLGPEGGLLLLIGHPLFQGILDPLEHETQDGVISPTRTSHHPFQPALLLRAQLGLLPRRKEAVQLADHVEGEMIGGGRGRV
jgi:hypothetical protein